MADITDLITTTFVDVASTQVCVTMISFVILCGLFLFLVHLFKH